MKKTRILEQHGCFKKWYRENVEIEFEKAEKLHEIGLDNNFIAPKPLKFNLKKHTIEFEYIRSLTSIRNVYLNVLHSSKPSDTDLHLFFTVGKILSSIHTSLLLSTSTPWVPSNYIKKVIKNDKTDFEEFLSSTPQAFLHGDFGFSNICIIHDNKGSKDDRKIVIIDSSYDGISILSSNTFGSNYLDLGHFVACIFGLIPIRKYFGAKWENVVAVRDQFISGYEDGNSMKIDRKLLYESAVLCASAKINKNYISPLTRKIASMILFSKRKGEILQW